MTFRQAIDLYVEDMRGEGRFNSPRTDRDYRRTLALHQSERNVRYALEALRDDDRITRLGRTKRGVWIYQVRMDSAGRRAPYRTATPALQDLHPPANGSGPGVQPASPDPSDDPSEPSGMQNPDGSVAGVSAPPRDHDEAADYLPGENPGHVLLIAQQLEAGRHEVTPEAVEQQLRSRGLLAEQQEEAESA